MELERLRDEEVAFRGGTECVLVRVALSKDTVDFILVASPVLAKPLSRSAADGTYPGDDDVMVNIEVVRGAITLAGDGGPKT